MSELRSTGDPVKVWAHRVLDEVRAGIGHDALTVARALALLGEPVGV